MLKFLINDILIRCNKIDLFFISKSEILIRIHESIEDENFNKLHKLFLNNVGKDIQFSKYKGVLRSITNNFESFNINIKLKDSVINPFVLNVTKNTFDNKKLKFSKVVKLIEKDKNVFIFEEPEYPEFFLEHFNNSTVLSFNESTYKIIKSEITCRYWNSLSVVLIVEKIIV